MYVPREVVERLMDATSCYEVTVLKYFTGQPVREATRTRIERAAQALGLTEHLPTPPDEQPDPRIASLEDESPEAVAARRLHGDGGWAPLPDGAPGVVAVAQGVVRRGGR